MKRCIVAVRAWCAEPLCDFLGVLLCCRSLSHYLWYIITFVYFIFFFFFFTIIAVTAWVLLYIQDKIFFFLHQSCIMNTNVAPPEWNESFQLRCMRQR